MGPLPKRKFSKGRTARRRAHDAIGTPQLTECSNCKKAKLPHRVCPHCGYYRGRQAMNVAAEKPGT